MNKVVRALLLGFALWIGAPAQAASPFEGCTGECSVQLTGPQLLAQAVALVEQRDFALARPFVDALSAVAKYRLEQQFLLGYIAVETGQYAQAIGHFRNVLAINPRDTRVRLELARALMLNGKQDAADYNFRLAAEDANLPPQIAATVRASRGLLRDSRQWYLSATAGLAPDTNINNGTDAQTIDFNFANLTIPLTLDRSARRRSGLGQTANLSAGWRGRMNETLALRVDLDGQGTNYRGKAVDDYTGQLSIGPEVAFGENLRLTAQAIGSQRWFGGIRAATQAGARATVQAEIGRSQRAGLTLDARHTASGFSDAYSGWSYGAYASYERVMMRTMVANATLFGRVDSLTAKVYSSRELGMNLGIGGELRHGINAGVSGGVSRALFDAPLRAFSLKPRRDWRVNARVYFGLRSVRVMGFSPSITYNYTRTGASLPLYANERSRIAFEIARFF